MVAVITTVVAVDRKKPFNPNEFFGRVWTIMEEDERSLSLWEVDFRKICLETYLRSGEQRITGEEKLRRLKNAGHIRLDAKVFQTIWNNKDKIPASWKEKTNGGRTYIFFDGTVLQHPSGSRCIFCLYWRDCEWSWHLSWLGSYWLADGPSAVLAR